MTTLCYPVSIPVRTTEPTEAQEPISLDDAKRQCGIAKDNDYLTEDVRGWIVAARQQVEREAEIICFTGAFTWKFTEFPCRDWFELPSRPVTAVSSITYVASDGDTDTWSSSEYALDTSPTTPIVKLTYGETWPTTRGDINGITVTYTAGYSTVLTIPQKVKQAVKLAVHISYLLATRDTVEAERQRVAYERQIELLRRSVYV